MRTVSLLLVAMLGALLLGAPARALAQPAPAAEAPDAARAKGEEGLALFAASRWAEAYDRFREADRLYHAPTLLLYMAHCQKNLGKLLRARTLYQQLLEEPLGKSAAEQFHKAQASARQELAALGARIPSIRVSVNGVGSEHPRIAVDGTAATPGPEGIEVDPGEHVIAVTADGADPFSRAVTVAEGATASLGVVLVAHSAPLPAPGATAADLANARGSLVPAGVAFGVGLLGLGLGGVTGALSLGQTSVVKSSCDASGHCPSTAQDAYNSASTLATASTAGFVVGAAGLAAGTVLFLVRPGGKGPPGEAPAKLRASFGPGSLRLDGAF